MSRQWFVYILRCNDESLYTGITTNLTRRLHEHNSQGKFCARYLRGKQPVQIVFQYAVLNRSAASKIERKIKQLSKDQKEALINNNASLSTLLICQPI